jgi:hypothetical protein
MDEWQIDRKAVLYFFFAPLRLCVKQFFASLYLTVLRVSALIFAIYKGESKTINALPTAVYLSRSTM